MATVVTKVEPIDRDLEVIFKDDLSPKARSQALASFAKEQLVEAQRVNRAAIGRVPRHETIVDGRRGAKEGDVRPDGTIVYDFELLQDVFRWIADMLERNSPKRTGRYARSHVFFADGIEADPAKPPEDAEDFVFASTVAYARKIERGLSRQAPDGVYQGVASLAARRFGNLARIRFTYVSLAGKSKGDRQPAISVKIR